MVVMKNPLIQGNLFFKEHLKNGLLNSKQISSVIMLDRISFCLALGTLWGVEITKKIRNQVQKTRDNLSTQSWKHKIMQVHKTWEREHSTAYNVFHFLIWFWILTDWLLNNSFWPFDKTFFPNIVLFTKIHMFRQRCQITYSIVF